MICKKVIAHNFINLPNDFDSNFESVNSYIKYLKDNPKISIDCKTFHNFFNLASNIQKHTLVQEIISIVKEQITNRTPKQTLQIHLKTLNKI